MTGSPSNSFPRIRLRRMRKRRIFAAADARNATDRRRADLSGFRRRRARRTPADRVDAGNRAPIDRPAAQGMRDPVAAAHPGDRDFPRHAGRQEEPGRARVVEPRRHRAARRARREEGVSGLGRDHGRRARPVHDSRPGRADRRGGLRHERPDRGDPRAAGPFACRRRGRRGRAVGHDGRAHRRDPRGIRDRRA